MGKLNYVGYWEEFGFNIPDHLCRSDPNAGEDVVIPNESLVGKTLSHNFLWGLLGRWNVMALLANILGEHNRSVVIDWETKFEHGLELGCDYGHTWSCYRDAVQHMHGIELGDSVKIGQELGHDIIQADMQTMPFDDNFFDLIISEHALEHVDDIDELLKQMYRVTKDGGWSGHILPCVPDNSAETPNDFHKTGLSYQAWKQKFIEHGFTVIRDFFTWAGNQEQYCIICRKLEEYDDTP